LVGSLLPRSPASPPKVQPFPTEENGSKRVWALRNGEAILVMVRTGASSERYTDIVSGGLQEGDEVIIEVAGV
jgi:hypothetical protein